MYEKICKCMKTFFYVKLLIILSYSRNENIRYELIFSESCKLTCIKFSVTPSIYLQHSMYILLCKVSYFK